MIYISHRGNLTGPDPLNENRPEYIEKAWSQGYDVEIDVWLKNGTFMLGHDEPQYPVDWKFLTNPALWCHAKNIEALSTMLNCGAHCFWHEKDKVTLTNRGFMWTYPGNKITRMSVCVMPESCGYEYFAKQPWLKSYGVCSDFVKEIKNGK
jgi:hypothetical protein